MSDPQEFDRELDRDIRLGALSGLLAVIMVVALAAMALVALQPQPIHFTGESAHAASGQIQAIDSK